jgi:predicted HicB family RNase H-like nuclease
MSEKERYKPTCQKHVFYKQVFQLRLDEVMHKRLQLMSKERRISMSEYIRGLLAEHMEKDAEAVAALKKFVQEEESEKI